MTREPTFKGPQWPRTQGTREGCRRVSAKRLSTRFSSVAGMVGPAEQVVTGDAVVLDVQIAQLPVRALSAMIDITVILVGYFIGVALWAATLSQFDTALSAAILVIFTVLTLIGYPLVFESATRGRSFGKMA